MLEGFVNVTATLRPGVYALLYAGVVVYIGQASKAPVDRIYAHRSLRGRKAPAWLPIKGMLFDEVHVMPCPVDRLNEVERALIDLYKPKYNTKLKSPHPVSQEITVTTPMGAVTLNAKPAATGVVRRF